MSRNWGFTKFARADYVAWKKAGRLINDGVNAKVHSLSVASYCDVVCAPASSRIVLCVQLLTNHGPLEARPLEHVIETPSRKHQIPIHYDGE